MVSKKRPNVDLKLKHRKVLELGLIGSLVIHLLLFRVVPAFDVSTGPATSADIEILVEDIPPTEQIKRPPPPPRPSIPVPTESEDIPEDMTIEVTDLDLSDITAPPPPPPDYGRYEEYEFIPYDNPPEPIGGYSRLHKNLKYPEIARKAGIEARVIVGVLIDEKGNSIRTQILKGAPSSTFGFEEAAQRALMKMKWRPALQRDRPVKVWVSIPINFRLDENRT